MNTIMIVDDDGSNVRFLAELLVQLGYRVKPFTIPGKALEHLTRQSPDVDLIILDVMMPRMTGCDFLNQLRADATTASIPVIFFSGYVEDDPPCGETVVPILKKPIELDALTSQLASLGL